MKILIVKDYSLTDSIKKRLGFIIKEVRLEKYKKYKNDHEDQLVSNNPYTKENLIENICHYNTLKKLEDDIVKDDYIYHQLLSKLNLHFQVEVEDHDYNMSLLEGLMNKALYSLEYMDFNAVNQLKTNLDQLDFSKDCISDFHKQVLLLIVSLNNFENIKESSVERLEIFLPFFKGIYEAILYHLLGIFYFRNHNSKKSELYLFKGKDLYERLKINNGIIMANIISVYKRNYNYYETVQLCHEVEPYYKRNNNYKRLNHIYSYLFEYYLLLNNYEMVDEYYAKAKELLSKDPSIENYHYIFDYHWGLKYLSDYKYLEAETAFKKAKDQCKVKAYKLNIYFYLILIMTKNKRDEQLIIEVIKEAESFCQYASEYDQILFKYFQLKYNSPNYYKRYTQEKILPLIKENYIERDITIFFYEDLYDNL